MNRLVSLAAIALLVASCAPKKSIEHLEMTHEGINVSLDISPDRESPSKINGKLRVVNAGSDMAQYGNFRLFLNADGKQVVTSVKTKVANAQVDTKNIHLSPSDTLHFFVHWDFGTPINFQKAVFKLDYVSAPVDTTTPVATPETPAQ